VIFFYTIIEVIPHDKGRKAILRITFKELDAKKHFKKLTVVDWKKLMLGRILLILGMGTVFTSLATQVQANSVKSESSNSNSLTLSDNSLSCDGKSYRFRGLPTWGEAGTSQAVSDGFFPEGTNVSPLPISVPTPSIST